MYQAFEEMPTLLKFITAHAFACILLIVVALIPSMPITFNGDTIESQELWAKGFRLPTMAIGLVMPVIGFLFLQRKQYCRQLYSVALVSVMVVSFAFWQDTSSVMFGAALSCAIIGYLFLNRRACAYFGS